MFHQSSMMKLSSFNYKLLHDSFIMAASTRKEVFLLGVRDVEPLSRLNQLPTVRQVLLRFHTHLNDAKSERNASYRLMDELKIL